MQFFLQLSFILSVVAGFAASWYAFKADYLKLVVVPIAFLLGFCASVSVFALFIAIVSLGLELFL